jgi:hypothetical protein
VDWPGFEPGASSVQDSRSTADLPAHGTVSGRRRVFSACGQLKRFSAVRAQTAWEMAENS